MGDEREKACEAALTDAGYSTGMCKMASNDGWTAAVASERERAAKIAETLFDEGSDISCSDRHCGEMIAAAIRGDQ